jgi:hypothetical protein
MTDPLGDDLVSERNRLRYAGNKVHSTQLFGMIELMRSKNLFIDSRGNVPLFKWKHIEQTDDEGRPRCYESWRRRFLL